MLFINISARNFFIIELVDSIGIRMSKMFQRRNTLKNAGIYSHYVHNYTFKHHAKNGYAPNTVQYISSIQH